MKTIGIRMPSYKAVSKEECQGMREEYGAEDNNTAIWDKWL